MSNFILNTYKFDGLCVYRKTSFSFGDCLQHDVSLHMKRSLQVKNNLRDSQQRNNNSINCNFMGIIVLTFVSYWIRVKSTLEEQEGPPIRVVTTAALIANKRVRIEMIS